MIPLIQKNIGKLKKICAVHSVAQLYLFGSAASGNFEDNSDLDFAVIFDEYLSPLEHGCLFCPKG